MGDTPDTEPVATYYVVRTRSPSGGRIVPQGIRVSVGMMV
jgi:hypothetical protein